MLRLIVSPPGTGKTSCVTEKIKADAGNLKSSAPVLIVPEQNHFETERMIYKKLGARIFARTEILSFTKLASKIVSENSENKAYAEDTIREITMLKTVCELREKLKFYKQSDSPDFATRMLSAISAFQREGTSPEELLKASEEMKSSRLKNKIADLVLIYGRYTEAITENYSDRQDEIRIAASLALQHKYFEGKSIYIDGFDGFTGGQFLLLEAALTQASSLVLTLTADKSDSADPRYVTSVKLAEKLKEAAKKRNVKTITESPEPYLPERNPKDNTEIFLLPDVYAESNFVAAKIRELITAGGYYQSEIAVLNPPSPRALEGAFSAYGITAFSDIPVSVIEKPMVRFIITVLEAVQGTPGAVLNIIKSGFLRVSGGQKRTQRPQIKLITQIAREMKIDGEDWYKPFPKKSEKAEKLRAEIIGKLTALYEKIKETTGDVITEELTGFLVNDLEIGRTIADIVYRGSKVDSALNDEYRQLWEKVISVFESMHGALKNQRISVADYTAVLSSVFGKTLIAKPPQVLDSVTLGDLRRSRIGNVKVVFLMGANQGEFPKNTFVGAQFSEAETERLCAAGIFIEENREARYYRERFLIGRAMTLPTEKLFITAPLRDEAWKEKKPSRLILEQQDKIKNSKDLPLSFWASHKNALKFQAAEKPREPALRQALSIIEPTEYERLFLNKKCTFLHKIDKVSAEALMKRESFSPSRIEALNTCLFRYFCAEGLKISTGKIKNDNEPDALTRGSMTHFVLEKVLKNHEKFTEIKPSQFIEIAKKYIAEFEEKEFGGWVRSARKKEILQAHAAGIAEVLKQMREDMELSDFKPFELEKAFEFKLGDMLIKGKIDRLDKFENNVRVIDYKTGSKDFSYPEIEYGLNMQALIYLFAVINLNENYKPSGAFYRLVNGGRLSEDYKLYGASESSEDLYKNRLETQKTTGIQFGETSSDIESINNKLKQNTATKREFIKLVNLGNEEFAELAEKAAIQLKERLCSLYSGDVRAVPTYLKNSPCKHCDYKNICGNAGKQKEIRVGADSISARSEE